MSRLLIIGTVLAASVFVLAACGEKDDAVSDEEVAAVAAAEAAYQQAVAAGTDLTNGPCISEALPGAEGWVADVVHDPRTEVDDDPANQCQSYLNASLDHFVEITTEGVVVGAE